MQYNIPDVHPAAVLSVFHQNMRSRKMRGELVVNKVADVAELYVLADKCARAEVGRKYHGKDTGVGSESEYEDVVAPAKKGRRRNRKRKGKTVLAVEESGGPDTAKKAKVDDPDKEVAGCAACQALAVVDKPEGSDKQYCKIHRTKVHDFQNCRQVEQLVERQKAEYERRDKEKGQDGAEGSGKKRGGPGGATARRSNMRGLLEAAKRRREMMTTKRMTSPVTKNFKRPQKPCASMVAPCCILLTASLNSGRTRSMRQSHRSTPRSH